MAIHPDSYPQARSPVWLSSERSLKLDFLRNTFIKRDGGDFIRYPAFGMMAEITRTGAAWSPNWSFRNGDPVGELVEYADDDELRWNEPPNCGGGPLIETSGATNGIRNPRSENALPGALPSTGQLPTNWTYYSTSAVTATVVGRGREDGWDYIEIEYAGTAAGAEVILINFDAHSQMSASASQTYTRSFGARIVSGSLTNTTVQSYLISYLSGAVVDQYAVDLSVDTTHRRFVKAETLSASTVDSIAAGFRLVFTAGAVSLKLRVYVPQTESGSFATSPVLPVVGSPAASTRGAETRSGGLNFQRSSWATHLDWDGSNGGVVRGMKEFLPNTPCHVPGKKLQIFEAVTNSVRNPRGEGFVAGDIDAGGALPTYWSDVENGTVFTAVETATIDGVPGFILDVSGTAAGSFILRFEGSSQIAGLNTEVWTSSAVLKLVSGDLTNIGTPQIGYDIRNSGGTLLTSKVESFALDSTLRRFFCTATNDESTSAYVQPMLKFAGASGAVSFRIFIGVPQMEKRAFPTNPVLPAPGTPAATTKAADVCNFATSDWSAGDGMSFFVEFHAPWTSEATSRTNVLSFDDTSFNNLINVWITTSNDLTLRHSNNGSADNINVALGTLDAKANNFRLAASLLANDMYMAGNDGTLTQTGSDTSFLLADIMSNATRLSLGSDPAGRYLNGSVSRLDWVNQQWSDSEIDDFVEI
jgi:hypothetical protein